MFASTIRQRLAARDDSSRHSQVQCIQTWMRYWRTQLFLIVTDEFDSDSCVCQTSGARKRGSQPARRLASTHNLVQEYIYEIICIKILAPIFTNALIFFLQRRTNFSATKLSKGLRRRSETRGNTSFYCNSFLITHFLSNKSARV